MKSIVSIWEDKKNNDIKGHINFMNHHNFYWMEIADNIERDNRFNSGFEIWKENEKYV